ncbi:MAG: 16S rRNA (cytosine(1402)-N(4))-methyltransferase RsmH [Patescibacteria group bacterium]
MRTRPFLQSSGDPVEGIPSSLLGVNHRPNPVGDGHRTVLLHEATNSLALKPSDVVVDATLGGGGHAREILGHLGKNGVFIGFDADEEAIERCRKLFSTQQAAVHFVHANFRNIKTELEKLSVGRITKALFDLGWSSFQLSAGRGFSFRSDEPLSMAYDKGQKLTAATIVNEWGEESIADVIFGFGEERYSRRIAKAIVEARERKSITTALELGEIVKDAVPAAYRHGKTHPATKTFQALRIAVNDELGALTEGLEGAWEMLESGGRIAVISFHSIEDRIVKRRFAQWAKEGAGELVSRKPIPPTDAEIAENPRARSAKLRVILKN